MPQELLATYRKVAPHPEDLRMFHDKAAQRMREFKDIPIEVIRHVNAPTLVVVGDADVIRPEHAVAAFHLLPHARRAVLPHRSHAGDRAHRVAGADDRWLPRRTGGKVTRQAVAAIDSTFVHAPDSSCGTRSAGFKATLAVTSDTSPCQCDTAP